MSRAEGVWGEAQIANFQKELGKMGYAFQFANSDRNPIEYWAPLDLATHLAYASFGYSPTRWYNLNGSVGYGPSRDRDNDWRNIWRVWSAVWPRSKSSSPIASRNGKSWCRI